MARFALLAAAAVAALAAASAGARAGTAQCGETSYSYAGISSSLARYGISARIAALSQPRIATGHVAGWVGVGGAGLGPAGSDEWLQVGISAVAGQDPALYYEVALPGRAPRYVMLAGHVPAGKSYDVAVLEARRQPGHWRVWVNGSPMTGAFHLPGSHGAWRPIATGESWNGDSAGTCNGFAFEFAHVRVAAKPGGAWQPLSGRVLSDAGYRVERRRNGSLVALGG